MMYGAIVFFLLIFFLDIQDIVEYSPSRMQFRKLSTVSIFSPLHFILLKTEIKNYDHILKKLFFKKDLSSEINDWELSAYTKSKYLIFPLFFHEYYHELPSYLTSDVKTVGSLVSWEKLDQKDESIKEFFEEIRLSFLRKEYALIIKRLYSFLQNNSKNKDI